MVIHKCIYQQIFSKYGMPEMAAIFCKVDDIMYSDLPRAEFIYSEQIGRAEVCAIILLRRDKKLFSRLTF